MNEVLKIHNLTKTFRASEPKGHSIKQAVDHVNITLYKGDIYGLIGRNGAGKTTLMRLVSGLMLPTKGEITLFGSNDLTLHRKRTGCVIEAPGLYDNMSARDNLETHRRLLGIIDPQIVDSSLIKVGLSDIGSKKVRCFSLGMRQRLGIAIALLGRPDLLILDEPTNGLDPRGISEIQGILLSLNAEQGVTILISSHILGELSKIATCYGIMRDGVIIDTFSKEALDTQCRKCLKIVVDQPQRAATLIETLLGTTNYDLLPGNTLLLFDYLDQGGLVNRALNMNGIIVESIMPVGQNIENYFMSMTGGEINA